MVTIFFGKETSGILKSKVTLLGVVFVQSVKVQNDKILDFEVYYIKIKTIMVPKILQREFPSLCIKLWPRLKKYF
jgi:hypothetical protein